MSVCVYIDGRPAECREDYREVIGRLGPILDESQGRFELWTNQPRGLGPIYPTVTKPMRTALQGLRRLEHYVRWMSPHCPLVAIGGIDLSGIEAIWSAGVDCAVVLRVIVDADDPRRATLDLLATTPRLGYGFDTA